MSSAYHTKQTQKYGGGGGGEFTDTFERLGERGKIVQIFVRSGSLVDNITCVFADGTSISHGGQGGSLSNIDFEDDEYVTGFKVRSGSKLDAITFITNKRTYGPYGGKGGGETTFDFNGKYLQYLFGRSGSLIDAIGFAYGDKLPTKAVHITKTAAVGGSGGGVWDNLDSLRHVLLRIKKIRVKSGSRVDRLEFTYTTGADDTTFSQGGGGGGYGPDFILNEDEYITEVTGRSGSRLDAVQFVLNTGRRSVVYGGGGGGPFTLTAPENSCVCAFHGRSGSEIDALGVYYSSRIPLRVVFYELQFHASSFAYTTISNGDFAKARLQNSTSIPQSMSETRSFTYEVKTSSSFSSSFSQTMEYSFEAGFSFEGMGAKETIKMSYTAGYTTTNGKEETTSQTRSYTFNVVAPANKTIEGTLVGVYYKCSVPWTGKARVYYNTGDFSEQTINGVLQDVTASDFTATYKEV